MITRDTTKHLLTAGIIILVVLIIGGYSYFASHGLIDGPSIIVDIPSTTASSLGSSGDMTSNTISPKNGIIYGEVATSSVIIAGVAERVNTLTLNGQPIVIDTHGNFSETILLFPGYNIETLQGQDKFKRSTSIQIELTYRTR